MASTARPAIKRTYASKRTAPLSSSPHPTRPTSSRTQSQLSDSDSDDEPLWLKQSTKTPKPSTSASRAPLKRSRSLLGSSPSAPTSQLSASTNSLPPSSPPTSSLTHNNNDKPALRRSPRKTKTIPEADESEPKRGRKSTLPATVAEPVAKQSLKGKEKAGPLNLHSFFAPVSPQRRQVPTPKSTSPSTRSSRAASPTQPPPAKVKKTKPVMLTQLYLDPFDTAGHATISCSECSLTYARTPEDMAVHARHHAKVLSGCDWLANSSASSAKGVTVLEEGVEWAGGKGEGKVVMVEGDVSGLAGKRLRDVLETVDATLSATALSQEQLAESKAFLFVTAQRKVIACALVQRITHAFRVIDAPSDEQTAAASPVVSTPSEADEVTPEPSARLIQFGDDEGALFCAPTPLPTLLGVHRIWTSPSHRRAGLATVLLNAAAQRCIYGYPIAKGRRGSDVAFSQPTGKGQALARRWTGGGELRVFVD